MSIKVILSQGRAADRSAMTLKGAALTAQALADEFGAYPTTVGTPAPPAVDDWTDSLAQARPTLLSIRNAVAKSILSGELTVLVANTCSISLASLPIVAREFPDAALLWIDAHGDFNTPHTSASGYLGGMVVAAACGLWNSGHGSGLDPSNVIFVGARDIDPAEQTLIDRFGVQVIAPAAVTPAAILEAVGERKVWVHIDWDVLEPGYVPADYDVPGGLLPEQIGAILQALGPDRILGLELAEYQAPDDPQLSRMALATIIKTVSPLLGRVTVDSL